MSTQRRELSHVPRGAASVPLLALAASAVMAVAGGALLGHRRGHRRRRDALASPSEQPDVLPALIPGAQVQPIGLAEDSIACTAIQVFQPWCSQPVPLHGEGVATPASTFEAKPCPCSVDFEDDTCGLDVCKESALVAQPRLPSAPSSLLDHDELEAGTCCWALQVMQPWCASPSVGASAEEEEEMEEGAAAERSLRTYDCGGCPGQASPCFAPSTPCASSHDSDTNDASDIICLQQRSGTAEKLEATAAAAFDASTGGGVTDPSESIKLAAAQPFAPGTPSVSASPSLARIASWTAHGTAAAPQPQQQRQRQSYSGRRGGAGGEGALEPATPPELDVPVTVLMGNPLFVAAIAAAAGARRRLEFDNPFFGAEGEEEEGEEEFAATVVGAAGEQHQQLVVEVVGTAAGKCRTLDLQLQLAREVEVEEAVQSPAAPATPARVAPSPAAPLSPPGSAASSAGVPHRLPAVSAPATRPGSRAAATKAAKVAAGPAAVIRPPFRPASKYSLAPPTAQPPVRRAIATTGSGGVQAAAAFRRSSVTSAAGPWADLPRFMRPTQAFLTASSARAASAAAPQAATASAQPPQQQHRAEGRAIAGGAVGPAAPPSKLRWR